MSIFEDVLEVHYKAENRVEDVRHVETIRRALEKVEAVPEDVTVVLNWDSLAYIAGGLDVEPEYTGHVPRQHVELRPEKIELALDTDAMVFGTESGTSFGVVLDPHAVRYDNSIANQDNVVAIDFTDDY
jgi:hypothetical protein